MTTSFPAGGVILGAMEFPGVTAGLPGSVADAAVCTGVELGTEELTGIAADEWESAEVAEAVVFDC